MDIVGRLRDKATRLLADQPDEQEIAMMLTVAANAIERLRADVAQFEADAMGRGAEHAMKSFREIKQEIKNGPSV